MFITKKQLEEIRRGLAVLGVRDTDLPKAVNLSGDELVAIVQDGENRILPIADLFSKYAQELIDYSARGESAYDIAIKHGFVGSEEDWLASLQAAIGIVNDCNHPNEIYKALSAAQGAVLKSLIDSLSNSTNNSIININSSIQELRRLIGNINPGANITVRNEYVNDTKNPSSAAKLYELKQQVDKIINNGGTAYDVKTWQYLTTELLSVPLDTDTTTLVNLRVAYELKKMLDSLSSRVAALERSSGTSGSGGSEIVTHSITIESAGNEINSTGTLQLTATYYTYSSNYTLHEDITHLSDCVWTCSNQYATVGNGAITGGLVSGQNTSGTESKTVVVTATYKGITKSITITVKAQQDDVTPVSRPSISIFPAGPVVVTAEGKFRPYGEDTSSTGFTVSTSNPTSAAWEVYDDSSVTWFDYSINGNVINVSNALKNLNTSSGRDATIYVRLVDDKTRTASLTFNQLAASESMDLRIIDFNGDDHSTMPKMGGTLALVVQSPGTWSFIANDEYPDGVSFSPVSGGAGETLVNVYIPGLDEEDNSRHLYFSVRLDGEFDSANYDVYQDKTIVDFIDIQDIDGIRQMSMAATAGTHSFKVFASGPWTVEERDTSGDDWCSPTQSGGWAGEATTADGVVRSLSVTYNSSNGPKSETLVAKLTGKNKERSMYIVQWPDTTALVYSFYFSDNVGLDGGTTSLHVDKRNDAATVWYVIMSSVPSWMHIPASYMTDGGRYAQCNGSAITGITIDSSEEARQATISAFVSGLNTMTATFYQVDSAGKGEGEPTFNAFLVNGPSGNLYPYNTTSVSIKVISSDPWEITDTTGEILSLSKSSGSATTDAGEIITATINSNNTNALKNYTIKFHSSNSNVNDITVGFGQEKGITFYTTPNSVNIGSNIGGYGTVNLYSSVNWQASLVSGSNYFNINPSSGSASQNAQSITVTAIGHAISQNNTGVLRLTADNCAPIDVTITQQKRSGGGGGGGDITGDYLYIDGATTRSVGPDSGSGTLSVKANVSWYAVASGNITIVSGGSGSGNETLSYSFIANDDTDNPAVSTITLKGSDSTVSDVQFILTQSAASGGGGDEPVVPDVPQFSVSNNYVTITCATSGATIYYKTGSGSYSIYSSAIEINEDTTFTAYSELGGVSSETATYTAEYDDGGSAAPYYTISVTPTGGMKSAASGSANVTIIGKYHDNGTVTDATWTISADTGIDASKYSGTGSDTVLISWDANASTTQTVTKSVTISCGQAPDTVTAVFTIVQSPAEPATEWTIADDETSGINILEFSADEVTHTLYVTCNRPWSSSFSPGSGQSTWLHGYTASGAANETVTISLSATQSTSRQTGVLSFTTNDSGTSNTRSISCSCEAALNNVE